MISIHLGDHTSLGISLANEAQYLLLTRSSVKYLHTILTDKLGEDNTVGSLGRYTMSFILFKAVSG